MSAQRILDDHLAAHPVCEQCGDEPAVKAGLVEDAERPDTFRPLAVCATCEVLAMTTPAGGD